MAMSPTARGVRIMWVALVVALIAAAVSPPAGGSLSGVLVPILVALSIGVGILWLRKKRPTEQGDDTRAQLP